MKKIYIPAIAMAFSAGLYAQSPIAAKYAKIITAEDAKKHLSILASDEYEGRETAKPGATMAANYIAGEFKKLGLQAPVNGSYFQDVPLLSTTAQGKSLSINGTAFAPRKDFNIGSYLTGETKDYDFKASEVIYLGHKVGGDPAAELGTTNITGKAVFLVNDGENRQSIAKRLTFIQSKHPSIIITSTSGNGFGGPGGQRGGQRGGGNGAPRASLSIKPDKPIVAPAPVISIMPEAANQLVSSSGETFETFKASGDANGMQANQTIKADIALTISTTCEQTKAAEVLGYMPGTDLKDEVLVFSAHYDHLGLTTSGTDKVYNGADDDGSGTTGILEIATAFAQAKKEGHGPRRSILFLGNVGEEKGLLGSEYYTDHPIYPMANTITDLNIDMIGRVGEEYVGKPDSANYVYVIGSSMLSSDLHKINDEANAKYTKLDLDYKYDDLKDPNRYYYRSDHYNFAKHNVPIIFYFNGVHADYHQATDEIGKINFPLLAKRAQLVFYTGWELANRDKRPVVDGNTGKQ
ncbi:M28 family peptidase [Mucilaginibacter sp. AW1-3]